MTEAALARSLGLPRTALKDVRRERLEKGAHWDDPPQGITYTEAGLALVREALADSGKISSEVVQEALEGAGDGPRYPRTVEVRICRIWPHQSGMFEAELDGEIVVVRVRDVSLFVKGMVVQALQDSPGDRVLYYRGRYPRSRGRL